MASDFTFRSHASYILQGNFYPGLSGFKAAFPGLCCNSMKNIGIEIRHAPCYTVAISIDAGDDPA
jgi:hypothetical protein